jgi:hypothetical protein
MVPNIFSRSNSNVQTVVGRYNKEDLVLLLPPEKPTVHQVPVLKNIPVPALANPDLSKLV